MSRPTTLLKQALKPILDEVFEGLAPQREWTEREYTTRVLTLVEQQGLDLNEFRPEIVSTLVKSDVEARTRIDPFLLGDDGTFQLELFDIDISDRAVIRRGNGTRVTISQATIFDLQARQMNQIRAGKDALARAETTAAVINSSVGQLMTRDSELTLKDAVLRLRS